MYRNNQVRFSDSQEKYIREQIFKYLKYTPGPKGTGIIFLQGNGIPNSLLGANTNVYLDLGTGDIYQKINGVWIFIVNLTGIPGENGENGSMLLYGDGVPQPDLGASGDTYIDLQTDDVYVKNGDIWILSGNISGDPGQKGEPGDNGDVVIIDTAGFSAFTIEVPPPPPTSVSIVLAPTSTTSPYYNLNNMISLTGDVTIDMDGYWFIYANFKVNNSSPTEIFQVFIRFRDSLNVALFEAGRDNLMADSIRDVNVSSNLFLTAGQYTFTATYFISGVLPPDRYPTFTYGVHLFAPVSP